MADPIAEQGCSSRCLGTNSLKNLATSRKEKRKALKKLKRKQIRKEIALKERAEEEARLNDPEEQLKIRLKEREEAEMMDREWKVFEERERLCMEAIQRRKVEEEAQQQKLLEELQATEQVEQENQLDEEETLEYTEDEPAEIIWQGNEIIVKKRARAAKKTISQQVVEEDVDRPISNPLPPQSAAFSAHRSESSVSAQQVLDVAQKIPNFGTEQDKAHCPFHFKTGSCRFGLRCSRVHFYPDKSCTLLIKNMYNGPGLALEQDEGLEYTDEEVERCYEEFYEDVHTEFLKFGELVNFKVCKNGSFHLRGNVYVHYKSLESAVLAYNCINGRFFGGKQITCEFVGVTRWKVAICGEYMKSWFKTCSHGTACNFIHCFRNPGGDYEWADWDNPPPKYWVKKMAVLFGQSDDFGDTKHMGLDSPGLPRNTSKNKKANSGRNRLSMKQSSRRKKTTSSPDELSEEKSSFDVHEHNGKYRASGYNYTPDNYDEDGDEHSSHSTEGPSNWKKKSNLPDEYAQSQEVSDTKNEGYRTHEHDSEREYSGKQTRYGSSSMGRWSGQKNKENSPNDEEELGGAYGKKDGVYKGKGPRHHGSGRGYSVSKGLRHKIHSSKRPCPRTCRVKELPGEHGKFKENYDSDDCEFYDSKQKVHGCEADMCRPQEYRRSRDEYEFHNHDHYTDGYRSMEQDSGEGYSSKRRVRHGNHLRRAYSSSRRKERHSLQVEDNEGHETSKCNYHEQDNKQIASGKLEADESFFSDQCHGWDKEGSYSRWEGTCDRSLENESDQAVGTKNGRRHKQQYDMDCVSGVSDVRSPKFATVVSEKRLRSQSPVRHFRGSQRRRRERSHDSGGF